MVTTGTDLVMIHAHFFNPDLRNGVPDHPGTFIFKTITPRDTILEIGIMDQISTLKFPKHWSH
jgi:hypothetical protein